MKPASKHKKITIIIVVFVMLILTIFITSTFLHIDSPKKEDFLTERLRAYSWCQISYYNEKGRFFSKGMEESACGSFSGIKLYYSLDEFSKAHPDICVAPPIGIAADSFTIIGEANIDGETKILCVNDMGYVFPPHTLPKGGGKCPEK